jgi:hypothetical protein
MKKLILIFFVVIFFPACGGASGVTISEIEYKQALGQAVCETVNILNKKGILNDEAKFAEEFDPLIQNSITNMGYTSKDWLAAKAKFFPSEEEHNKLIKLHFTWCLLGDSISK